MRFGSFHLDLANAELHKDGARLRLQGQPFRVLAMLVERAGDVVSREELRQHVWGQETTVDFDHGLDVAINKVREVLEDSATAPRYIETLARRGYRFIGKIEEVAPPGSIELLSQPPSEVPLAHTAKMVVTEISAQSTNRPSVRWILLAATASAIALIGLAILKAIEFTRPPLKPAYIREITDSGRVYPGLPLQESLGQTATDGSRLYFSQIQNGRIVLSQASVDDGETTVLPFPVAGAAPVIENISPDGTKLLLRNQAVRETEGPIWIMPTIGGHIQQFGELLAHDASWTPDGKQILYANGADLLLAAEDGSDIRHFASVPGRAFWMRWSPDGKRLRFTLLNPLDHGMSLWEIDAEGRHPHPLHPGQKNALTECCGSWTADGKYFVYQATRNGQSNIWAIREGGLLNALLPQRPFVVTNGPLNYRSPVVSSNGNTVFFLGLNTHSELLQYDHATKSFIPNLRLHTAQYVRYSRDGQWVTWIGLRGSTLWRSRTDGSQALQLTPAGLEVYMVEWSPDGNHLILMAREPGKLWRLYMVDRDGSNLVGLLDEKRNQADPSWASANDEVVFGRPPDVMAERAQLKEIYLLHTSTGAVEPIKGSQGLFSPRSSPDGLYIAALPLGQRSLMLFDRRQGMWRTLVAQPAADPIWSRDGQWIYFHDFQGKAQSIYRVRVHDGFVERVASVGDLQSIEFADFRFVGLTPEDLPLIRARVSTGNLYSATLNAPDPIP